VKIDSKQIAVVKRKPDWTAIKTAYLNGDGSFRDLAKQFNVSFHTIAKRAKREDWTGEMAKLCDAVATTAMNTATERGKELGMTAGDFVERSIRETERWLNRIEALAGDGKLTPDTLQKLVNSWRTALAAGREAFGLDSREPRVLFDVTILDREPSSCVVDHECPLAIEAAVVSTPKSESNTGG